MHNVPRSPSGMKTVSIAVDERLLEQIDTVVQARQLKRSEFFCEAARYWLKQQRIKKLVEKDRKGYRRQPVQPEEFGPLIRAQQWEMKVKEALHFSLGFDD